MKLARILVPTFFLVALIATSFWFAGYRHGRNYVSTGVATHEHQWGQWEKPLFSKDERFQKCYLQFHSCTNCGFSEYRFVEKAE